MKLDMLAFDKVGNKFWGPYLSRFKDEEKIKDLVDVLPDLEAYMVKHLNGNKYLSGGDEPMMIDFHVYPIIERIVFLEDSPW